MKWMMMSEQRSRLTRVSYTPPAFLVESCSSPRSPATVLHQSSLSPYVRVEVLRQSSSSPPLVRPQSVHSTWSPHGWSKEWTDCGRTGEGLIHLFGERTWPAKRCTFTRSAGVWVGQSGVREGA